MKPLFSVMFAKLLFSLKLDKKTLVLNFNSHFWSVLTLVVKGGERCTCKDWWVFGMLKLQHSLLLPMVKMTALELMHLWSSVAARQIFMSYL